MTDVLDLEQRREILASMPWVAVSPPAGFFKKRCEGHRTQRPMYAYRLAKDDPKMEKWACRNRARWVFLGLDGRIRTFCWHHLFIEGFEGDRDEEKRYRKWIDQYAKTHPWPPIPSDEDRPVTQQ